MEDLAGRTLHVGDVVAVVLAGHVNLHKGTVSRFTEKQVVVDLFVRRNLRRINRYPNQLVVILPLDLVVQEGENNA